MKKHLLILAVALLALTVRARASQTVAAPTAVAAKKCKKKKAHSAKKKNCKKKKQAGPQGPQGPQGPPGPPGCPRYSGDDRDAGAGRELHDCRWWPAVHPQLEQHDGQPDG